MHHADTASSIRPKEAAVDEAELVLQQSANRIFREAVEAVAVWIDGFDDAFGLELLASVHWVGTRTDPAARNASEALRRLHDWNDGKKHRFDIGHVRAAWSRLEDAGLLATTVPDEGTPSRPVAAERPEPTGDLIENAL